MHDVPFNIAHRTLKTEGLSLLMFIESRAQGEYRIATPNNRIVA